VHLSRVNEPGSRSHVHMYFSLTHGYIPYRKFSAMNALRDARYAYECIENAINKRMHELYDKNQV